MLVPFNHLNRLACLGTCAKLRAKVGNNGVLLRLDTVASSQNVLRGNQCSATECIVQKLEPETRNVRIVFDIGLGAAVNAALLVDGEPRVLNRSFSGLVVRKCVSICYGKECRREREDLSNLHTDEAR